MRFDWGHVTKICTSLLVSFLMCLIRVTPVCFLIWFWGHFGPEFMGECSWRQLRTLAAQPPPVSCCLSTEQSDTTVWLSDFGNCLKMWICQVLWKWDHSAVHGCSHPLANANCCIAPLLFPSHCNAFPTLQSDKHSQFFPPPAAALSNVSSDVGRHSPRVSPPRRGTIHMLPYFFPAYLPWRILTSLCNINSRLTAPYPLKCFGKPHQNWPNNISANFTFQNKSTALMQSTFTRPLAWGVMKKSSWVVLRSLLVGFHLYSMC